MKNKDPKRLYYKIGEVCKLVDVEPHVLRYWESEFPMLVPSKNRSGQRIYRVRDVEIVRIIKRLLYNEGFTIAGAKKRIPQEIRKRADLFSGEEGLADTALPSPDTEITTPAPADPANRELSAEAKLLNVRAELENLLTLLDRTV